MPELASLPEKHKDQPAHTSTDMKANNNNKDKSGSGTIAEPSSMSSVTTTIATQQGPSLDNTPKAGEEEAEEGEVMEDVEEGELEEDDTKGVPSQDQSQSQSQSQSQIQNNEQKVEGEQDMKEASPEPAVEDEEASSAMSTDKPEQSHIGEEINEDDLNGGLLDGALDDYDDLDQDTEDTEVGNGDHDFSDDDDDDDDDLLDQQLMSDKLDPDDVEMHTPNTLAEAKSEEHHADAHGEDEEDEDEAAGSANEKDAPHSEDSDSDLPDPDPSDMEDGEVNEDAQDEDEEDEEEDEEGNADEEDEDEEEDEAQKMAPTPKKDVVFPQKPTLNRSQATEEELKDSGDELSDLSEFDDTDDSDEDEDDRVPEPKSGGKDLPTSAPSGVSSSAPSKSGGSGSSSGTGKTGAGGRKKSVQENTDDKQDASKGKSIAAPSTDQKVEHPVEVPNGRARLIEPAGRNRAVSNAETNHSDKDSGSDAAEENDEEDEEAPEETPVAAERDEEQEEGGDEEDDDLETKQIHKEALEALTSIEVEFASLRDKMYEERMMELDKEVEMINSGTHPELSSLMQEIAQKREQRLQVADAGKRYKSEIAQSQFEVAEYLAHCTFQSARRNARGDMAKDLGSKQRKMILELTVSADTQKRKVLAEKSTLIRARKQRRMEVAELKGISERRAFPASSKLTMVSSTELEDDFSAMGLARLLPQPAQPVQPTQPQYIPEQEMYGHRPMAPSAPGPVGYGPSMQHPSRAPPVHNSHSNMWPEPDYPPQHPNMVPPSGRYYDSRQEVEIYVDGNRCNIDGMWYKPQDLVVVLDAQIGKYKAKYLFLANDEIVLQRTNGSKTKLHLGLFRGRKLYMQPQ